MELYGRVNRGGGDGSVGAVRVGQTAGDWHFPHKHSKYILTRKTKKVIKR